MGGRKLGSWVAASAPAQPGGSGRLVLLVDEVTGDKFLVDTGAVFSVLPSLQMNHQLAHGLPPPMLLQFLAGVGWSGGYVLAVFASVGDS